MTEETTIETITVALLKTSAAITVQPYRASEDTLPEDGYIAVIVDNKEPAMHAYAPHIRPSFWQSRMTIALELSERDAAKAEGIIEAIDALMQAGSSPPEIVTLALTSFPNGLTIDQTTGGEDMAENVEVRSTTRFYMARWGSNATANPLPSLSITSVTGGEGSVAQFSVVLSAPSTVTVTVNYSTSDDTATQPEDYLPQAGTLTFAPGEAEKEINIEIENDAIAEPAETFAVHLSDPVNATIASGIGTCTITDITP